MNAIAQRLASRALTLMSKLEAMADDPTLPGGAPDQSIEGAATVKHGEYHDRIERELARVLKQLREMHFTLDASGNLVSTVGVNITHGAV